MSTSTRRTRSLRALAAPLAVGLLITACGGSEPAAAPAPATAPAPAPAPEPEAEGTALFDEEEIAAFYSGETFRVIVGFSPGGGYDTYARAIAEHLGKHIPGNPTVIVENLTGAGSLVSANQLFSTLPSDGTVMGHFIGGLLIGQVLGNPAALFESRDFNFVGAAVADTTTCVARADSGVTDLAQLRDRAEPLIFGGTGTGANTDDVPNTLSTFLGLNLSLVTGYAGTADVRLAMETGEVDAGCWAWESQRSVLADELASGFLVPIAQAGDTPHPDNPDTPLFRDLATNAEELQIINAAIDGPALFARPFAMHPDTPLDRVAAIRAAFAATMDDPAFREMAASSNLAIDPVSADRLEELVGALYSLSAERQAQLAEVFIPPQ